MAVPKYNELMLPLLKYAGDGEVHHVQDAGVAVGDYMGLTGDQLSEMLDSGKMTKFYNRIHWAKTYLTKAGLLESAGRGLFRITKRGFQVLEENPTEIDNKYLKQFSEFVEFQKPSANSTQDKIVEEDIETEQTPEELMQTTHRKLRAGLADDLLETVLSVSPAFFEKLVVDLLLAMGYGSALDSGERIGRSGDGGIDGVIREDKLGLDMIYIQAKRWAKDNGVGRPDVQAFAGSLMGVGASKGVFITTSYFTEQAMQYAESVNNLKVILLDGQQLATLMIEHNVGVSVRETFVVKQIDENYFPDL